MHQYQGIGVYITRLLRIRFSQLVSDIYRENRGMDRVALRLDCKVLHFSYVSEEQPHGIEYTATCTHPQTSLLFLEYLPLASILPSTGMTLRAVKI